jgi:hypothetical protein
LSVARGAAIAYASVTAGVVIFQLALACGAPWGSYAMGGRFPGRFPPSMRAAAVLQAVLLAALAAVVLSHAGLAAWSPAAGWLIWAVVAFAALSVVLNAITKSAGERRIWLPVAIVMLGTSLLVALARD